jgi:hypothetical protein
MYSFFSTQGGKMAKSKSIGYVILNMVYDTIASSIQRLMLEAYSVSCDVDENKNKPLKEKPGYIEINGDELIDKIAVLILVFRGYLTKSSYGENAYSITRKGIHFVVNPDQMKLFEDDNPR